MENLAICHENMITQQLNCGTRIFFLFKIEKHFVR